MAEQNDASNISQQVVYSSTEEQIFSMLFIGSFASFTIVAQLLVLVTIIKSPTLHNVHFCIIAAYCCGDLISVSIAGPNYMVLFITGSVPDLYCRILSTVVICVVLGMTYHTAYIAYERYIYFCQPYKYDEYLSTRNVLLAMLVCYGIPTIIGVTTEIQIGRTYHASILACNLPNSAVQSLVQFVVILLPSAVVTVYSTLKVWRLTKKAQISPQMMNAGAGGGAGAGEVTPVNQAIKALRMVLLISGTFWGTILPGYIIRVVTLNVGFTWDDLDARRYMGPAIAMRIATFSYSTISAAANPLIYYYSRRDLRVATCRMLWRNAAVHPFPADSRERENRNI